MGEAVHAQISVSPCGNRVVIYRLFAILEEMNGNTFFNQTKFVCIASWLNIVFEENNFKEFSIQN